MSFEGLQEDAEARIFCISILHNQTFELLRLFNLECKSRIKYPLAQINFPLSWSNQFRKK